jgi:hypothetical protein
MPPARSTNLFLFVLLVIVLLVPSIGSNASPQTDELEKAGSELPTQHTVGRHIKAEGVPNFGDIFFATNTFSNWRGLL